MTGMIDHRCSNYSHGIVSQNCFAKKYTSSGVEVELILTGTFVQVHSIRDDDVLFCIVHDDMQVELTQMVCKKADIISVPENLWGPLFTVKKEARLSLLKDTKAAESIGNISVGHTVQVLAPDNSVVCIANVTFKNSIAILGVGIYFGLQVLSPRENLPLIIERVSLLEPGTKGFPRGCDIVVTVDRLFPSSSSSSGSREKSVWNHEKEDQRQSVRRFSFGEEPGSGGFKSVSGCYGKDRLGNSCKKAQHRNSTDSEASVNHSLKKIMNSENSLNVGDEVIYLNGDTPERGVVRWSGFIENSLKVGVEFDNPIGSGRGTVEGLGELFRTKYQHALVVPPMALVKVSDFYNNSKENIHYKKNNFNNNSSNNNNSINTNTKTNNNNSINNNNDYITSNEFCCSGQQGTEEKVRKSKKVSLSQQYLKYGEKGFESNEVEEEVRDSGRSQVRAEGSGWKSLDTGKQSERKMSYRRNCNSVDNSMIQADSGSCMNGNSLTGLSSWNSPDLYDLAEARPERNHSHCCPELKVHKCSPGEEEFAFHRATVTQPSEKNSRDFVEEDKWESQFAEPSNSDEYLPGYCEPSKPSQSDRYGSEDLGKGSVVELSFRGEPHYGVIRWIGTLTEKRDDGAPPLIAGVEMEEECADFTDGTFNNKRYFHCNPRKALFVPLAKCRKDSRFLEDSHRQTFSSKVNYGQIDCPVVEGTVPPINTKGDIESICGKNRGIQGHHNSCYLDATLFSMFAFTSVFDSLLYRPPTNSDIPQYVEVQRVLREEIVNPLRKNLYVRADRVMKLRTLLEKLSSISGLTSEEKDPEEFLNSLLAQILKAEPFLKLSSGQEAFHYQLFVEKDERLTLPSVQLLFEQSFVTSDIKLKQVPSCLIIQMPRFGKSFKMYSRILPPQLLDITDIIENSPRQCTVCGKLAEYECKDCFGQQGIGNGLESISFCKACLDTAHNHHCRSSHNARALTVPVEFYELQDHCIIPRLFMELFAVVCIETSHYVAFVKCGSGSDAPWCFFDSMADRKGEQNGYNIPEMVPCPDLPYWLSEEGAKMLNEMQDERQLPEHAKRLFSDAYMCMYQSPDLMMYR